MTYKIFIGNLSRNVQDKDLRLLFSKYGKVVEAAVVKDYGFVHMSVEDEAKEAIDALNGSEFMGTNIVVEMSTSKIHKTPGVGSKGECFKCGKKGHWSRDCYLDPRNGREPPMRGRPPPPRDYRDRYYEGPPSRIYSRGPPPPIDYERGRYPLPPDPYRRPPPPYDYPPDPYAYRGRSRSPPPMRRLPPSPPPFGRPTISPRYDRPPLPPRPRDPYLEPPPPRRYVMGRASPPPLHRGIPLPPRPRPRPY